MKKEDVIKTCRSALAKVTPLDTDCGKICGAFCCHGDGKTGMLLFPGEEALTDGNIEIIRNDAGDKIAVCNGKCDRHKRPLACRIYPLFPIIRSENGKEYIETVFDSRANCPLTTGEYKISNRFSKTVKRVGKYLLLNPETADFYRKLSEEITDYAELEKLLKKF